MDIDPSLSETDCHSSPAETLEDEITERFIGQDMQNVFPSPEEVSEGLSLIEESESQMNDETRSDSESNHIGDLNVLDTEALMHQLYTFEEGDDEYFIPSLPKELQSRLQEITSLTPSCPTLMKFWSEETSPKKHKILEYLITSLRRMLSEYMPAYENFSHLSSDSPEVLVVLLQDCFEQYRRKVTESKLKIKELKQETEEIRHSSADRYQTLVEEHKERLNRVIQDHELQLSSAVERAMNARRQASSLQSQLVIALARIQVLESDNKHTLDTTEANYQQRITYISKENKLLNEKVSNLEYQLKQQKKGLKQLESIKCHENMNLDLNDKISLEKDLAVVKTELLTLKKELKREKDENLNNCNELKKKSQQAAVFKVKLESITQDLSHKEQLVEELKKDLLHKVGALLPKVISKLPQGTDTASSLDWLASMKEFSSQKEMELKQAYESLSFNELEMKELSIKLKSNQSSINHMNDQNNFLEAKIKERSVDLKNKQQKLNEYNERMNKLEFEISTLNSKIKEREMLTESLKSVSKRRFEKLEKLAKRAKEEKMKSSQLREAIKALERQVSMLNNKLKDLSRNRDVLKGDCLSIECHISHLKKVIEGKHRLSYKLEKDLKHSNSKLDNYLNYSLYENSSYDSTTKNEERNLANESIIIPQRAYLCGGQHPKSATMQTKSIDYLDLHGLINEEFKQNDLFLKDLNGIENLTSTPKIGTDEGRAFSLPHQVQQFVQSPNESMSLPLKDYNSARRSLDFKDLSQKLPLSDLDASDMSHLNSIPNSDSSHFEADRSLESTVETFSLGNLSIQKSFSSHDLLNQSSAQLKSPVLSQRKETESLPIYSAQNLQSSQNMKPITLNIQLEPSKSQNPGERFEYNIAVNLNPHGAAIRHPSLDGSFTSPSIQSPNTSLPAYLDQK